ncbi:hypothetical protein JNJ66_00225 [Candidatus Saccharibacteria bacterium]|nr:hypothetical protein [Candidatus Saccharibacteria bacterium]
MYDTTPFINRDFLTFLEANDGLGPRNVRELAGTYAELLTYGWTSDELLLAAQTGYNYSTHRLPEEGVPVHLWHFNAGGGPENFRAWLQHHYERCKAGEAGIAIEAFTEHWAVLSVPLFAGELGSGRSLGRIRAYIRARRAGLEHDECLWLAQWNAMRHREYLQLRRRGMERELAEDLVDQCRLYGQLVLARYLLEAHRRGASRDDLLDAIRHDRVRALALDLRRTDRELAAVAAQGAQDPSA